MHSGQLVGSDLTPLILPCGEGDIRHGRAASLAGSNDDGDYDHDYGLWAD